MTNLPLKPIRGPNKTKKYKGWVEVMMCYLIWSSFNPSVGQSLSQNLHMDPNQLHRKQQPLINMFL